jgi:hypothetical protein
MLSKNVLGRLNRQEISSALANGRVALESGQFGAFLADLVSQAPRTTVEQICWRFYDRQLASGLDENSPADAFYDSLHDSMARADPAFGYYVEPADFRRELNAMHFEIFGIALTKRLGWQHEGICLRELVATNRYLQERGEQELWHAMGHYNRALGQAGFAMVRRRNRVEWGRRVMSARIESMQRSQQRGVSPECVARYANRYGSDLIWRSGNGVLALIQALEERLEFRVSGEAQLRLHSLLHVFYDQAVRALLNARPF